jgi:hypothetical protein
VIVRISGTGQYELDDDSVKKLDELDTALTNAYHTGNDADFRACLHKAVTFVEQAGKPVPHEQILPSDVIMPPDDSGLEDAKDFMSNEGLTVPLEA